MFHDTNRTGDQVGQRRDAGSACSRDSVSPMMMMMMIIKCDQERKR